MSDPFDLDTEDFDDVIEDVTDGDDASDASDGSEAVEVGADEIRQELEALRQEREAARIAQEQAQAAYQWQAQQAELDAKEQAVAAKRRAALEADDLDAETEALAELMDIRLQKQAMAQRQQEAAQPTPSAEDRIAPAAKAWVELNPEFNTDPAFRKKAKELSKLLESRGFKPSDPNLYRELDKLLADQSAPKKRQQAGQVAGVSRGNAMAAKRPASQSKLTNDDLRSMRKYNMDPNNPNHRRAWAKRNAPLI